ncbi:MAG: hypothetical protein HUJ27_08580 [Rhodobacteraceae bacterium]|nr:hypothetical protein [Paracoccaceae bacterium]
MSKVVDYFKELAAQNPYFGADPVQPDPRYLESLSRSNGVETQAEVNGNEVILRQSPGAELLRATSGTTTEARKPFNLGVAKEEEDELQPDLVSSDEDTLMADSGSDDIDDEQENLLDVRDQEKDLKRPAASRRRVKNSSFGMLLSRMAAEEKARHEEEQAKKTAHGTADELRRALNSVETESEEPENAFSEFAARHVPSPEEDEEVLDHILAETDSHFEDEAENRRRSAIAHLKAAVAATKSGQVPASGKGGIDDFREDLAAAVKPVREEPPKTKAPFKLDDSGQQKPENRTRSEWSESRVNPRLEDTLFSETFGAESPFGEEIEEEYDDNLFRGSISYADFAQRMGVEDLPDLIEAAAAYVTFIEGRSQMTRPQIMRLVTSLEGYAFPREDGLRAFGVLLRDGRIKNLRRGLFAVSSNTRFRPAMRAVG